MTVDAEIALVDRLKASLLERLKTAPSAEWPRLLREFAGILSEVGPPEWDGLAAILAELTDEVRTLVGLPGRSSLQSSRWDPLLDEAPINCDEILARRWVRTLAPGTPPLSTRFRPAADYIEGHYAEQLSVRCLAQAMARRQHEVADLFQQETGLSVHKYITMVRMRHAQELIRQGHKIQAVALLVGYRSRKNFYRQFKACVGVTPGSFQTVWGSTARMQPLMPPDRSRREPIARSHTVRRSEPGRP